MLQVPWLPDAVLGWTRELWVKRSFSTGLSMTRDLPKEELGEFQRLMATPGAVTALLNHYRALRYEWSADRGGRLRRIECETLLIWGERERFFSEEMKTPGREWVPFSEQLTLLGAGRFPQMERPTAVNEALLAFIRPSFGEERPVLGSSAIEAAG